MSGEWLMMNPWWWWWWWLHDEVMTLKYDNLFTEELGNDVDRLSPQKHILPFLLSNQDTALAAGQSSLAARFLPFVLDSIFRNEIILWNKRTYQRTETNTILNFTKSSGDTKLSGNTNFNFGTLAIRNYLAIRISISELWRYEIIWQYEFQFRIF